MVITLKTIKGVVICLITMEIVSTTTAIINNNAEGTYEVGDYLVYVNTKGDTQILSCYFVLDEVDEPIVDKKPMKGEER